MILYIGYVKKIKIMIMIMISYNVLQKRLSSQKYKKCSPGKYAIRSGFYTLDFYKIWLPHYTGTLTNKKTDKCHDNGFEWMLKNIQCIK